MYEKYFKPFTDIEYHYEIKNCLETAYQEGFAKGLAEAREKIRAKGCEEGQREMFLALARKLKARGDSVAGIVDLTGLEETEIAGLE
jgi:flagellar biosynthesis/type III secretory pathway protein FliH